MTRWFSVSALILAGTVALGAQPRPAAVGPFTQNSRCPTASRDPARDTSVPVVSVNVWYHVGSAQRAARPHRLRASVRAPDVRGLGHVPEGEFDNWLEARRRQQQRLDRATTAPTTSIDVPSNALELALFLESDRMGYLLDDDDAEHVDGQRDVVKNERRQSYENQPYGMAVIELRGDALSAQDHPYTGRRSATWRTSPRPATTTSCEFFKTYYAPTNASLVDRRRHRHRRRRASWSRSGSAT